MASFNPMRTAIIVLLLAAWCPTTAMARILSMRIANIQTAIAELTDVQVHLQWPDAAPAGLLSVKIAQIKLEGLTEPFQQIDWRCSLHHQGADDWRCDGHIRKGEGASLQLRVDWSEATTRVELTHATSSVGMYRTSTTPDLTRIDLTRVPLVWLQPWLATLWPEAQMQAGQMDGAVEVLTTPASPLQIEATVELAGIALDTTNGEIAIADVGVQAAITARLEDSGPHLQMGSTLHGGEVLFGNTYLALPATPVTLALEAQHTDKDGWQLPHVLWHDGDVLEVEAALKWTANAELAALHARLRSDDLSAWPARYLSGWLGLAGLRGLTIKGALDMQVALSPLGTQSMDVLLRAVDLHDTEGRFTLDGLDGHLAYSLTGEHDGTLTWHSGTLGGLPFGPAHWPLHSRAGELRVTSPVYIDLLDGRLSVPSVHLRLPQANAGWQLDFGLGLHHLDLGRLSAALGWPAFRGHITGSLPAVRYADGRLSLDGGLALEIFDGRIDITRLAMERPFGVAPTLSADLALFDLDLMAITEQFDAGSISGRLDGRIDNLRLVDWAPTAFDAEFHTVARRGVRQRISQRAVQAISSVGDTSFTHSLQGRLIGLFDDFGYRHIGIGCRLHNEVCQMSGVSPVGAGFTLVEGAGIPKLTVIGWGHDVAWPTLVERVLSATHSDLSPVVQ